MPAPPVTDGGHPQPGTSGPEGRPARRLLAVAPVTHAGGAETGLLRLLSRLQSRGWRVTLTTPGSGPLRDAALDAGHDWTALGVGRLGAGTGAPAIASWVRIRRLARAASVEVLARRDSMGVAAHEGAKRFYAAAYADRVERLVA